MGNSSIVTPKFCDLIKLSVGTIMEPHQNWSKDIFRNLGSQTAVWVYLKRQLK